MGTKLVRVSDLTGQEAEETELTQLVVEQHPNFQSEIMLEVLPEEIEERLPDPKALVVVSYQSPGEPTPQRYVMLLEEFNNLFSGERQSDVVLEEALFQGQVPEEKPQRTRRRQAKPRVDYTSPEHAGEPHRGTISEAEKEYVRDHLDAVNERLRGQGIREIDPDDPEMAERYGLSAPKVG